MSMTKRHIDSPSQEERDEIFGRIDPDDEEEWDAYQANGFREEELGGVFDGFGVISDADPGL